MELCVPEDRLEAVILEAFAVIANAFCQRGVHRVVSKGYSGYTQ